MVKKSTEAKILAWITSPQTKQQGVSKIIELYQKPLYWHIRKMVISHDDAKDILQEIFLRVWNNVHNFRGGSSLSTWLYRIATNETLRFLEKKKRQIENQNRLEELLVKQLESSELINGNKIQMELQKAILQLPEKQRLVFNMRYFDEMKYELIAEILETTVNSAKVSYHHAKTKIEQNLKEEFIL